MSSIRPTDSLTSTRTQSLSSTTILNQDEIYSKVDKIKLYECILKILILEYINEARFKTPIIDETTESKNSLTTQVSPKKNRASRIYGLESNDKLSSSVYNNLEQYLNLVAMKKRGSKLDDNTRRSFLRFYSELLDPKIKEDLKTNNSLDYLLMKFTSCANKEVTKLGNFPPSDISNIVFKQCNEFVSYLIQIVEKEKNAELIIKKLNEHRDSLKPKPSTPSISNNSNSSNVKYLKPSYNVKDMDKGLIELLVKLFKVDNTKLQQDIFKFKDLAQEKQLHNDIKQILFYLDKDLGQYNPRSFVEEEYYQQWKSREQAGCEYLTNKYQIPAAMKLMSIPKLPPGEDFYVLPPSSMTRAFFTILVKLCLELQQSDTYGTPDKPLITKQSVSLINLCGKFWRIDYPTKAACVFTASHLAGILRDPLYPVNDVKDLAPVDIENSTQVLHYCKTIIEDQGKLSWEDKDSWSTKDRDEWTKNLTFSYNSTMYSIKESLQIIFSKVTKPKFGPVLVFLGDYIESDVLFTNVEQSGLVKKWEKKLSKTLLRVAELRYAELLENLPRDNSLNILHVLDISDSIVGDIKSLQKKYKNPLLGFLNVSKTVGAVMTSMFAVDSKNILKHIETYSRKKGEFIHYGDSLEAYKSLSEIRSIYNQVTLTDTPFKFNLEKFFFPSLNDWVTESSTKILNIVNEAIKSDKFEPIDLENDDKKFSTSVLDIFSLIKQFLSILDKLNWENHYQLSKVYTLLLKSISDGVLKYTNSITEKIIHELNEEEQKKLTEMNNDKRKSGGGWFDEMKNVVNNIQISSKIETEEPYNFRPETCVGLNNLSAMMQQLTQLEDILDPEMISSTVKSHEPNRQNYFTSHIFSIRLIKAENIASGSSSNLRPYVSLLDTSVRKTIGKTRTINNTSNPEWDEEFEVTLSPNANLNLSITVWDEKLGSHSVCGRAILQLDPRRFKHDGIPQEILLDLDTQGRLFIEVAVESERVDAIFVMGRAHRALLRSQERCIKLIVEKFSRFIHLCFSRNNLKSICGNNGHIKPTQSQMDDAMMPLYDYLNSNLQVLAQYLTNDLLMKVMIAAWIVVVSSADDLLLPKLVSAKTFKISNLGSKLSSKTNSQSSNNGWQSAVTSAMANVTNSMGISGFGKQLTHNELETVFSWLNFLCFDFFHNDGNGPPVKDLKNESYQALLLLPVYYDRDIDYLKQEVERLSPAFVKSLRDRNNFDNSNFNEKGRPRSLSRASTMARNKTIMANATSKARAKAKMEELEARQDPVAAQASAEDIILRLLLIRDEKSFVARRLDQREKLAHSIATERLARAAAEGKFSR
ncbi:uncharacterized protein CLIB1444_01S17766 [[Candida] jaroonii]|uniref:Uncharacterized protein n=1 Tax=[Candida] jaroonii TaxID=467808 RepID=A0ACA9Y1V8_9ASCO|nr:uncharacterized protein CLIB1444_01S17766 [[Candida] jaroonii]